MNIVKCPFSVANALIENHHFLFPKHVVLTKLQFSNSTIYHSSFAQLCQAILTHMAKRKCQSVVQSNLENMMAASPIKGQTIQDV